MGSGMIYEPDEQGNNVQFIQRLDLVARICALYKNRALLLL